MSDFTRQVNYHTLHNGQAPMAAADRVFCVSVNAWRLAAAALLIPAGWGCCYGTAGCVEARSVEAAKRPLDVQGQPIPIAYPRPGQDQGPTQDKAPAKPDEKSPKRTLDLPPEFPGMEAAPLNVPKLDRTAAPEKTAKILRQLFPEVPPAPPLANQQGAQGGPMHLAELQQIAVENSPALRRAAAEVDAARGDAIQKGAYPNPTVGYQADTVNTADTLGYQGAFVSQEIVTAGKLSYAQCAAVMRVRNAQCKLTLARIALGSDVRRAYFQTLVAQERVTFARAVAKLTEDAFKLQIDQVQNGEAAAYEPLQMRVLAVQAKNAVIQAENGHWIAWRQLTAKLGTPDLPLAWLDGNVEAVVPDISFDAAKSALLLRHSALQAAAAEIQATLFDLQLEQVTPIPNVHVYSAVQRDYTSPLNDMSYNLQVGVPIPLYNKNKGNIIAAEARVVQSRHSLVNTRNELLARLADAHGRFNANRNVVLSYRSDILQDQVRVYRGVYQSFRTQGTQVQLSDVVVAQQTLVQAVSAYLDVLQAYWLATVDLAELTQACDLYALEADDSTMVVGQHEILVPEIE